MPVRAVGLLGRYRRLERVGVPRYRGGTGSGALFVEAGQALPGLDGVLYPAGVGEGHPGKFQDAALVGLKPERRVYVALRRHYGDLPEVEGLDVLRLPPAPDLDAVREDDDDGVVVRRGLGDGLHV